MEIEIHSVKKIEREEIVASNGVNHKRTLKIYQSNGESLTLLLSSGIEDNLKIKKI